MVNKIVRPCSRVQDGGLDQAGEMHNLRRLATDLANLLLSEKRDFKDEKGNWAK
jgi:hypothetical protein